MDVPLVICGYCQEEMRPLPSGSLVCPKCGRFAAKTQPPAPPPHP